MKTDPSFDDLVDALRSDLPTERDSERLRMRLAALGLAASNALVASSAAASSAAVGTSSALAASSTSAASTAASSATAASSTGASLGTSLAISSQAVAHAGGLSWAAKVGVVTAMSMTAVAAPAWYVHHRHVGAMPVASASAAARGAATLASSRRVSGNPRSPRVSQRMAGDSEAPPRTALGVTAANDDVGGPAVPDATDRVMPGSNPESSRASAVREPRTGASSAAVEARAAALSPSVGAVSASTADFTRAEPEQQRATTLREETALLDRALSALTAQDFAGAELLLNEHERRFPNGLLAQERERSRRRLAELRRQGGVR
jgi:hypothetical protein